MCNLIDKLFADKKYLLEIFVILLVVVGLYFTHSQLKQNEKLSRNTYLTGLWNEIMKESINYPQFQNKLKTATYQESFSFEEQIQYENYARWIGGFIEDLYFYDYENNNLLFFEPTIETFLDLHCEWFTDHVEYYKYTVGLYERLNKLECKSD